MWTNYKHQTLYIRTKLYQKHNLRIFIIPLEFRVRQIYSDTPGISAVNISKIATTLTNA